MLPSSGFFNRFTCPDARSGECNRPYCHFGGHTSVAASFPACDPVPNGNTQVNDATTIVDPVPSYSTVPTEHFQGYQGYFATSSSPPPAVPKRGLLPTPPAPVSAALRSSRPAQHVRPTVQRTPRQQQNSISKKPAPHQPRANIVEKKPEPNLNSLARDLAAINNEIERLQRKLANSGEQGGSGDDTTANTDNDDTTTDDVPGYDPTEPAAKRVRYGSGHDSASSANNATDSSSDEQQYRPQAASKSSVASVSTYKPTPIGELQKPRNKLLKDSWIADGDSKVKKPVVSTKKAAPKDKIASVKPVALLEKKTKPGSSTVTDLFGDDSDSESTATASASDRRGTFSKKASASKSKEDPEDMASIIEDFIAPTTMATAHRREKPGVVKKDSSNSDNVTIGKKRVAALSNSSIESAKKLREAGGERPKGHLMSARQQLESRMAQLSKTQEELKSKQREENEVRKQQISAKVPPSGEIGTHPKGGDKRVARAPKPVDVTRQAAGGRPVLATEVGGKVPTNVRQQYLNLMFDEFVKFLPESEANQQALEEERTVFSKSTSRAGYLNAVANAIKRIREVSASSSSATQSDSSTKKAVSHSAVIGGKPASKASFTVGRSGGGGAKVSSTLSDRRSTNLPGEEFYDALLPFVLSPEQQATNGYPRQDPNKPGCAIYAKDEIKKMYIDDEELKRICIRCGKQFHLTPDGEYIWRDDCIFHWGRAWKKRIAGSMESRYTCCQEDLSSAGCSVSRYHVSDCMPRRALSGYVNTSDWPGQVGSPDAKVFALDCEMVYTTCGNELARVTVVNDQCQVVYERCIRPENTILDYNTRFSGLTEDLLLKNAAAVSREEVQQDLAALFTSEAILVGHSLESDFRALKLIHDKVVDTSVVFPHRLGAPYKRALKTLAVEFLKKIIQDDVDGHDSKEDAITCMDLMKWRVKQDRR